MDRDFKWVIRILILVGVAFVLAGLLGCGSADEKKCGNWYIGETFYGIPKYERICTYNGFTCKETYFNGQVEDSCFGGTSSVEAPVVQGG